MATRLRNLPARLGAALLMVALIGVGLPLLWQVWLGRDRVTIQLELEEPRGLRPGAVVRTSWEAPPVGIVRRVEPVVGRWLEVERLTPESQGLLVGGGDFATRPWRVTEWAVRAVTGGLEWSISAVPARGSMVATTGQGETRRLWMLPLCGPIRELTATRAGTGWRSVVTLAAGELEPGCVRPVGLWEAGEGLPPQRPRVDVQGTTWVLRLPIADPGLQMASASLVDAVGGDSETVTLEADGQGARATVSWADRRLTPVVPGNGQLEGLVPESLGRALVSETGAARLCVRGKAGATEGPGIWVLSAGESCPTGFEALSAGLEPGNERDVGMGGEVWHLRLRREPLQVSRIEALVDKRFFGDSTGEGTGARAWISHQFGLRAAELHLEEATSGVQRGLTGGSRWVQGVEARGEDLERIWTYLAEPMRVGDAPLTRLEAIFSGGQTATVQAATLLGGVDRALKPLLSKDFVALEEVPAAVLEVLGQTGALVGELRRVTASVDPKTGTQVGRIMTDLETAASRLPPLMTALSATDEKSLAKGPVLVRETLDALQSMQGTLEKAGVLLGQLEQTARTLDEVSATVDPNETAKTLSVLGEQTRRVFREMEVLAWRMNRSLLLRYRQTPAEVGAETGGATGTEAGAAGVESRRREGETSPVKGTPP